VLDSTELLERLHARADGASPFRSIVLLRSRSPYPQTRRHR
jgi:hypothetical protein